MSSIGFDTSNYTTSVALYSDDGIINSRKLLPVKHGERGLRQSDALFHHVRQFPEIIKSIDNITNVRAVGVSSKPRNVEGSYMPVFLAGVAFGQTAASVLNVPMYEFSHQDGHIMAGIVSSGAFELLKGDFISVHLSGGTTEILKSSYNGYNFVSQIIGGTKDISAGQLIDRIGVSIGLEFPCGRELEILSNNSIEPVKLPVCCDGGYFNFSGIETKALNMKDVQKENLSSGIFSVISKTLAEAISYCCNKTNINRVLVVGGVASNLIIRKYLIDNTTCNYYFASGELSSDNACGIAALAEFADVGR